MMNLILDFGNTLTKVAVFDDTTILYLEKIQKAGISFIEKLLDQYSETEHCIISSVSEHPRELQDYLNSRLRLCLELDYRTPVPIKNNYLTPKSLGYDRIAGLMGAYSEYPGYNLLVIDAGSAITYDFLSSKAEYPGGNISPGAYMRAKSLNKFTSRLPMVDPDESFPLLGDSTESAINAGIMNGIVFEMDAYIYRLREIYSDLKVFLTGGDSKLFDKKLKNHIFVDSNLNLKGLNRILSYNVN